MDRRSCLTGLLAGAAVAGLPQRALADFMPTQPIMLTVGYPPGGSTDVAARLVGQGLSKSLRGTSVVVESRPGASGTVASGWLRRQAPDGYSLMISETASFAVMPAMSKTSYDPVEDFSWIATICTTPMILVVGADSPAKTAQDAIALLRAPNSQKLSYSSSGAGSMPHIAAELLNHVLGPSAQSVHVPYRGGAPAVLSVGKNETAWGVHAAGSAMGLITGGMLRALAVTGSRRFTPLPDVPTFAEIGLPEVEISAHYLLHAPSGLPRAISETLNKAANEGVQDLQTQERFLAAGMQIWGGDRSPDAARAVVVGEVARFRRIAEMTGIRI